MYKGKRILGFIPARGGSKGLPGKNVLSLCGKPLINWSIEAGLACRIIDTVLVSTDDKRIATVAQKAGAEVPFLRPASLARDGSKVIDAILHALAYYEGKGRPFDYVALLEPTSPLRRKGEIEEAIKKLVDAGSKADSVISVGEIQLEHPVYAKKIGKKGAVEAYAPSKYSMCLRQDIPTAYFPYGVVYVARTSELRRLGAPYGGRILPHFVERWQSYEINDKYDFACVEAVMKLNRREE